MSNEPGGPELISLRELARRLVAEGVLDRMSHQRVSQISREDPAFPPVLIVGRSKAVDWHKAESYFRGRTTQQGRRNDLKPPGETMPNPTRTFTPDELEAIGVPDELPGPNGPEVEGLAYELHREQVDTRRWVSVHELVFRAPDDGKAYRIHYEQGLTEDQDDTDPWNRETEIEATEVELRPVTVQRWLPIEAAPAAEVTL